MGVTLTVDQLRAIGEMQHCAGHAAREIARIQRLALQFDINVSGINLEQLKRVNEQLASLVLQHMRDVPEQRRETLATYHAPQTVAA